MVVIDLNKGNTWLIINHFHFLPYLFAQIIDLGYQEGHDLAKKMLVVDWYIENNDFRGHLAVYDKVFDPTKNYALYLYL